MFPSLEKRLRASHDQIAQIRFATGNAGLSVDILHGGQFLHQIHYGYRDVASKTIADGDTQYYLGAMSEMFSSLCYSILKQDAKFEMGTRLHEVIPELLSAPNIVPAPWSRVKNDSNLLDLVAHRTGLYQSNLFRLQSNGKLLMKPKDMNEVMSSLRNSTTNGFRSKMIYNDCTVTLLDRAIRHVIGDTMESLLRERVLTPLNLTRTTMGPCSAENHVTSYIALSDAKPHEVPPPAFEDEQIRTPGASVKSSINDLIRFLEALLRARIKEIARNHGRGSQLLDGPRLGYVVSMWDGVIKIDDDTDTKYARGWIDSKLPGKGRILGSNANDSDGLPVIGKGTRQQKLVYHQGCLIGASSAAYLLQESTTAVVVLSNFSDLGDTADWVAQLLLEIIVEAPEPSNFVELARKQHRNAFAAQDR